MNSFILQTARDYDIDYEIVEQFYTHNYNTFYIQLENYIKERSELKGKK